MSSQSFQLLCARSTMYRRPYHEFAFQFCPQKEEQAEVFPEASREGRAVEVERVMAKRIKHAVLNRADAIHRSTRCAPAPLMMPCCKERLNLLSYLLQFFLASQSSLSAFCCIVVAVSVWDYMPPSKGCFFFSCLTLLTSNAASPPENP